MYAEYYFQEDRNILSPLMDNLLVSFYWRRLIKEDLIADFKRWASTDDDNQVPDFIILGINNSKLTSPLPYFLFLYLKE
jgi:hypothetical protein